MIEKLTITKVSKTDEKKDPEDNTKKVKCIAKNGKPFWRVGIQTKEHGEAYINGLVFADEVTWNEGDVVTLEIREEEYNGVKGLKFEVPKEEDLKDDEIAKLKAQLAAKDKPEETTPETEEPEF